MRLVGACVTIAVIALFVIHWIPAKKEEGFSIESSSNPKVSEANTSKRNKVSNNEKAIKSEKVLTTEKSKRDGSEAVVVKRSGTPDGLIHGMSRNELDAFHQRQTQNIEKELLNSETKVMLPPSDDRSPVMTLHELNALHRQQMASLTREPIELVYAAGDGTSEARHAVISQVDLDLIHKEQLHQSTSTNDWVKLPPVSSENEPRALTIGQLNKMISQQQLAAEFNEVDDTKLIALPLSADGPHTFTNWDLIELHEQQDQSIRQ
jgi:hypothetical protein